MEQPIKCPVVLLDWMERLEISISKDTTGSNLKQIIVSNQDIKKPTIIKKLHLYLLWDLGIKKKMINDDDLIALQLQSGDKRLRIQQQQPKIGIAWYDQIYDVKIIFGNKYRYLSIGQKSTIANLFVYLKKSKYFLKQKYSLRLNNEYIDDYNQKIKNLDNLDNLIFQMKYDLTADQYEGIQLNLRLIIQVVDQENHENIQRIFELNNNQSFNTMKDKLINSLGNNSKIDSDDRIIVREGILTGNLVTALNIAFRKIFPGRKQVKLFIFKQHPGG